MPTTSRTIAGSFSHSTRAYTTVARAASSNVFEVLGINRHGSGPPLKTSFRSFAKSASTTCTLLSLRYYGHQRIRQDHGRRGCSCDPVYLVVAHGFTGWALMVLPVAYKRFVDNVPKAIDDQLCAGNYKGFAGCSRGWIRAWLA